jgi:serine/threonine protein phosphatase 1
MKRQFAISDIHGCLRTFEALLDQIALTKDDDLYLLGDYVDRGPDSKGVIDKIWQLQAEGYNVQCLAGNHEHMTLDDEKLGSENGWHRLGQYNYFLSSFDANNMQEVPIKYYDWMRNLPLFFEISGFVLVHAGLNFRSKNPLSDPKELLWIRNWHDQINYDWLGDRIIVHGHQPIHKEDIEAMHQSLPYLRVIDIDAGCSAFKRTTGHLCAYNLTENTLHFQKSLDFLKN